MIHYDIELKKFVQDQQKVLSQKSKAAAINPFFVPNRLGIPYIESQNEFNSQLMTLNVDEPTTDISNMGEEMHDSADPIRGFRFLNYLLFREIFQLKILHPVTDT